jgi:hypothetical protein
MGDGRRDRSGSLAGGRESKILRKDPDSGSNSRTNVSFSNGNKILRYRLFIRDTNIRIEGKVNEAAMTKEGIVLPIIDRMRLWFSKQTQ